MNASREYCSSVVFGVFFRDEVEVFMVVVFGEGFSSWKKEKSGVGVVSSVLKKEKSSDFVKEPKSVDVSVEGSLFILESIWKWSGIRNVQWVRSKIRVG